MRLAIGSLVRDREWILPTFLECVRNLNFDKKIITLFFLVNDSEDSSTDILLDFKNEYKDLYEDIFVGHLNLKARKDSRVGNRRDIYKNLVDLRNFLLKFGRGFDYLFSVDSDILLNKEDLNNLFKCDKDIVSGVINNNSMANGKFIPNLMTIVNGKFTHCDNLKKEGIIEVDVCGAVTLMSNRTCYNTRYEYHDQGEDCGWAKVCKDKGFKMFANLEVSPFHCMSEENLWQYKTTY